MLIVFSVFFFFTRKLSSATVVVGRRLLTDLSPHLSALIFKLSNPANLWLGLVIFEISGTGVTWYASSLKNREKLFVE